MSPLCCTVDVEDWLQSSVDFDAELTERCVDNTREMLEVFDRLGLRGTWFVQGLVAKRYPALVAEIANRGHEVACHAHTHRPLFSMSVAELRDEIRTGKHAIEDAIGGPVRGFRAPDFSIGAPCDDLGELDRKVFTVLADAAFSYDSSIVPARTSRYGVTNAPAGPFRLREGLVEFPLATAWLGKRLPALGGGYLRLFPMLYHRVALWQAAVARRPAIVYVHPYELDTAEVRDVASRRQISWKFRLSQALGRGPRVERRLGVLRRSQTTQTMYQLYESLASRRDLQTL